MRVALLIATLLALGGPAAGQEATAPPVLIIDRDRLFAESGFGRRVVEEIEARSVELAAENRAIEAELIAEERDLTERRPELAPAEFRELADAFDEKVQRLRAEQDAKAAALVQLRDGERQAFIDLIGPVLADMLRETGAQVVLERRAVFAASERIDVTDEVITRIDATVGDGSPAGVEAPRTAPAATGLPANSAAPALPARGTTGDSAPDMPDMPAATDGPTTDEAPAASEGSAADDAPAETEAPATGNAPATTETPAAPDAGAD